MTRPLSIVHAVLMFVAVDSALAYTLIHPTASTGPLRWPSVEPPILMRLNEQTGPGLANITPDSDPVGAVERALVKFPAVSAVRLERGTTAIASGGRDGHNIVSFADTTANREVFEMAGGSSIAGLTLYFFISSNLSEADVLFNPELQFTTTLDSDAELRDAGLSDVEAVAVHELGHAIGLHHTGVQSATMWPITSVLQREVDADDIAGARTLYPEEGGRSTIVGSVTVEGTPAFGAQVVAVAESGAVAASALTLPDGGYAIEQLAPGRYHLYVEPLDGPHSSVPDVPCIRVGNLDGAGIYDNATLTTDFATTFLGEIDVAADQTAAVDFMPSSGATALNPAQVGPATVTNGSTSATVTARPFSVTAGTEQWIAVAGPDVDLVPIEGIDLGPDIVVDPDSRRVLFSTCPADMTPFPFLVFRVGIDTVAATGGRSIVLVTGEETAAISAALRILPGLLPCVGDCDTNGRVTVDELVRGVNIALGTASIDECRMFDSSGDGQVSVDELVQAVNAALNGCA